MKSVYNIARAFPHSLWAAYTLARYGWPRKFVFYNSGVGDDLLCTTVVRELYKRKSGKVWIGTKYCELFEGNSGATAVPAGDWRFGALASVLGADIRPLWYTQYDPADDRDPEPPLHFAAMMCRKAGITGEIAVRPYVYLGQEEIIEGRLVADQIAVQSTTRAAATPLQNKEWMPERFQSVVDSLASRFNLVQLGSPTDPKLGNVVDLRGKTTLRQAAAVLSNSRLFVGLAGGLMHLARAVDCPSVIVYGGRERPEISGYICNKNVKSDQPCSPCWQRNRCDYDRVCMTSIDPSMVLEAIHESLAESPEGQRNELPVEQVHL